MKKGNKNRNHASLIHGIGTRPDILRKRTTPTGTAMAAPHEKLSLKQSLEPPGGALVITITRANGSSLDLCTIGAGQSFPSLHPLPPTRPRSEAVTHGA